MWLYTCHSKLYATVTNITVSNNMEDGRLKQRAFCPSCREDMAIEQKCEAEMMVVEVCGAESSHGGRLG